MWQCDYFFWRHVHMTLSGTLPHVFSVSWKSGNAPKILLQSHLWLHFLHGVQPLHLKRHQVSAPHPQALLSWKNNINNITPYVYMYKNHSTAWKWYVENVWTYVLNVAKCYNLGWVKHKKKILADSRPQGIGAGWLRVMCRGPCMVHSSASEVISRLFLLPDSSCWVHSQPAPPSCQGK